MQQQNEKTFQENQGRPSYSQLKYADEIIKNLEQNGCEKKLNDGFVQSIYSNKTDKCYLFRNKKA